ncbi:MAG: CinA family protein [Candidatus Omnitrophota bacterium]
MAKLLIHNKKTLSLAESCTGGLLADRLTDISGSSKFFKLGIIAYSNKAKNKILKVPQKDLIKFGAVSSQVARKMAKGVRRILLTDFGLGITGIAGPLGSAKNKTIGLVYIAIDTSKNNLCFKYVFKGPRRQIKKKAADQALKLLEEILLKL